MLISKGKKKSSDVCFKEVKAFYLIHIWQSQKKNITNSQQTRENLRNQEK